MTSESKDWNNVYKSPSVSFPFSVAEPIHRVGPEGVSSGISFRELPEPCFEQVSPLISRTSLIYDVICYIGKARVSLLRSEMFWKV
jgi:hypothetical protein